MRKGKDPEPDPYPLAGTSKQKSTVIKNSNVADPDPKSTGYTCFWVFRIRILLSSCENSKKNLDSYYFVNLFDFLSLKNDLNVPSKSTQQKK
jgi:hypothetical protein